MLDEMWNIQKKTCFEKDASYFVLLAHGRISQT